MSVATAPAPIKPDHNGHSSVHAMHRAPTLSLYASQSSNIPHASPLSTVLGSSDPEYGVAQTYPSFLSGGLYPTTALQLPPRRSNKFSTSSTAPRNRPPSSSSGRPGRTFIARRESPSEAESDVDPDAEFKRILEQLRSGSGSLRHTSDVRGRHPPDDMFPHTINGGHTPAELLRHFKTEVLQLKDILTTTHTSVLVRLNKILDEVDGFAPESDTTMKETSLDSLNVLSDPQKSVRKSTEHEIGNVNFVDGMHLRCVSSLSRAHHAF